ncbi:dynactin [Coprinopsis marcescibilis]|uniref:Dynactin n=1 Tax=Coprinopsis marcescibilis TaxID=230819 RepID=A0A5C3KWL8_COPMA|nr:dynactin [Coprinopsis marcescibilis]
MSSDIALGSIVTVPQGRGVVRFVGPTSFQAVGTWYGIELDEPNGKNDGSVQGVQYFPCRPGHGVFVRLALIKGIHGTEMRNAPGSSSTARATTGAPRPGHQRTSSTSGTLRVGSARSTQQNTPSLSGSSTRSSSPAKPTSQTSSSALGRSTSVRPPPPPSPVKRASLSGLQVPPTPAAQPRKSLVFRQVSNSSNLGEPVPPTPSQGRGIVSPTAAPTSKRPSSPLAQPPETSSISAQISVLLNNEEIASPPPSHREADLQELQELRAKIRVLEARRADDARHVRELETRLTDAESFVALRPKLQAKLNSQQTELISARRELADAKQIAELAENRIADAHEQLEMSMLDKEVAEEKAELIEAELEDLKEKVAVLEIENSALKGEGEGGADAPARDSMAYMQLEKQNERLKEALIRLRDVSQETEQEQRRRIADMEKDVAALDELQAQYEETLIKLTNSESEIDSLKEQVDDALGAEDLLVQLTERNLELGEKIEEMRITIEDLEALVELNDELEENHMETEKQLHDDIEAKDMQLHESSRKIAALEEACQDYESTISKFRELVLQLQGDLEQLRAQTQSAQSDSATAASQTAAIMSLNLRLQSTASKNQARNVEFEIMSQEAREAREFLGIVQPYLPQMYVETDMDATNCYLFFQRLSCKADLINNIVAQAQNLPDALNGSVTEALVGVCEMRSRISGLSTLCKRFAAVLRRSDVETFLNMGRIYPEIAPLEKRIDMHIELLRRDEFREMECVSDVMKIHAQFEHLADTYLQGFEHDLAERELGYVLALDHDFDMCAASMGLTKTSISDITEDPDSIMDMGGYDVNQALFEPLQKVLNQCRSGKSLSKKLIKRLETLLKDSAAVKVHLLPQMKALTDNVAELVNFGISLAQSVMPHLSDVRAAKSPFQLTTVLGIVKQTAASTVAKEIKPGASVWDAISDYINQLMDEGNKLLPLTLEKENVQKITGTAPWITRVNDIKSALAVNVEAERKAQKAQEEIQSLARDVKTKEQAIQESSVKIEFMERKMEAAKKQADALTDLETELAKIRKNEKAYQDAIDQLQSDLDDSRKENDSLKTQVAGQERQVDGPQTVDHQDPVVVEGNYETSYLLEQLEALRGTIRYLRNENNFLKGQDLLREIELLAPIPDPALRVQTPPLVPSGNSDTEESDLEDPTAPVSLRSLATQTKLLYRDVIRFSSSPKVIDLSELNAKRVEAKTNKVWLPRKKAPAQQLLQRKLEGERLTKRVHGLVERANLLAAI